MCLRISYVGFTFEIQEEMGKRETLSASSFNVCRHSVFKDVSVYVCSLPKLRSLHLFVSFYVRVHVETERLGQTEQR